jgi:hypothetical protein
MSRAALLADYLKDGYFSLVNDDLVHRRGVPDYLAQIYKTPSYFRSFASKPSTLAEMALYSFLCSEKGQLMPFEQATNSSTHTTRLSGIASAVRTHPRATIESLQPVFQTAKIDFPDEVGTSPQKVVACRPTRGVLTGDELRTALELP